MDEREFEKRKQRMQKRRKRRLMRKIMRIIIVIILIVLLIGVGLLINKILHNQDEESVENEVPVVNQDIIIEVPDPEPVTATILSGGDVILHSPFISSNKYKQADGTYNYHDMFRFIKDDYDAADFTVLNLETTINDTIYSGYPIFRSPAAIVSALKDSSVDMCLVANNHIYDNGDHGFYCTLDTLDQYNMITLGGRRDVNENDYVIQDINGIKIGFMNYVYATGSASNLMINAIPVNAATAPLINTFTYENLSDLYSRIESNLSEMETAGVDYTIAYIHWGNEYQLTESSVQREIAANLCELGIDALIGGHPHVVQPVDVLANTDGSHQMICLYSVGNHVSNQHREYMDSMPTGHTEDGLMSRLTIEKDHKGNVQLITADVIPTWVYRTPNSTNPEYFIFNLEDESVVTEAGDLNIGADYTESLNRTNAIIGEGVTKIQNALPIAVNEQR